MSLVTLHDGRTIETNEETLRLPYDEEIAEGRFGHEVKSLKSRADFIARVKQFEKDCDELLKNPLGERNDGSSVTTVTTVTTDWCNDGNDGNDGAARGRNGRFHKGTKHPMSGRERIKAFRARKKANTVGAGDGQ